MRLARLFERPRQKRKSHLTHRSTFIYAVPTYVPVDAIQSPETPYFAQAEERAKQRGGGVLLLTAPRVCQLL